MAAVASAADSAGDLIVLRPEGLYCPAGGFFIDPWRPVERAVITHAHADHARRGHGAYLATAASEGVLRARLGAITLQGLRYGEVVDLAGVRVSLHPAGHVLGSAQVRVEHGGRVWVASGDYFTSGHADDVNSTCTPFEPVRCDCFITESTFGLPIYRWRPQAEVMAQINAWWQANADTGRASLLLGYSLGKAQRLLAGVDASIGPIVTHSAVEPLNEAYRAACGAGQRLGAPARRVQRRVCQRLDATARRAPAPGPRPWLRAQRPRRLARPAARHRGNVSQSRHRDPRLRSCDGALAAAAGPAGGQLQHRVRPRRRSAGSRDAGSGTRPRRQTSALMPGPISRSMFDPRQRGCRRGPGPLARAAARA